LLSGDAASGAKGVAGAAGAAAFFEGDVFSCAVLVRGCRAGVAVGLSGFFPEFFFMVGVSPSVAG